MGLRETLWCLGEVQTEAGPEGNTVLQITQSHHAKAQRRAVRVKKQNSARAFLLNLLSLLSPFLYLPRAGAKSGAAGVG